MKKFDIDNINKKEEKKSVNDFLSQRAVVSIATRNNDNNVWISNFYYVVDENFKIYYFTVKDTLHTKNILENNKVSFSIFWHSRITFLERMSVQGSGKVHKATEDEKKTALSLASKRFKDIEKNISEKVFLGEDTNIIFWVLEPEFIKYLDDDKYGDLESINFNIFYDEKK